MLRIVASIMNNAVKAASEAGHQNSPVTFAAPSIAAPVSLGGIDPEFTSMPAPSQVEPYSSLKRGMLYQLARAGHIRTVSLREPGKTRGRRLIVLSTLREYLRRLDAEQNGDANKGQGK